MLQSMNFINCMSGIHHYSILHQRSPSPGPRPILVHCLLGTLPNSSEWQVKEQNNVYICRLSPVLTSLPQLHLRSSQEYWSVVSKWLGTIVIHNNFLALNSLVFKNSFLNHMCLLNTKQSLLKISKRNYLNKGGETSLIPTKAISIVVYLLLHSFSFSFFQ